MVFKYSVAILGSGWNHVVMVMETRLAIGNEETNDGERKEAEARNYGAASINSKGKQTEQSKLRDEMTRGSKQEMIDDERRKEPWSKHTTARKRNYAMLAS